MAQTRELISKSVEDTQRFGEELGKLLRPGDVVGLIGELGAGKTTMIQGLAAGLGIDPALVKSPTFVLQREYPGRVPLIHIDGYRLEGQDSVIWLDLDLIFTRKHVTVIEWANRFEGSLPDDYVELRLEHLKASQRRISALAHGPRSQEIVAALSADAVKSESGGRG